MQCILQYTQNSVGKKAGKKTSIEQQLCGQKHPVDERGYLGMARLVQAHNLKESVHGGRPLANSRANIYSVYCCITRLPDSAA